MYWTERTREGLVNLTQKTRTPFRNAFANILLGVAIGAAVTLLGLKAAGVPLQPGLDTPAFRKFLSIYTDLHDKYFKAESDTTLINGAVDGMAKSLGDPFTEYLPPTDAMQLQNMLSGSYVGIGITIEQVNHKLVIQAVSKNAPADKAGLRPQDVIVKVNGTSLAGMSLDKATSLLLGPKGSQVTLTVDRPSVPGRSLTFTMKRAQIPKQTVFSKMLDKQIGYLQITVVADHTADEVKQQLAKLQQSGAKRIIVDLRGNPGGYLDEAVNIAGNFIPKGKVVVQWVGRDGGKNVMKSPGPGISLPIVVLMDENTASAAEILAAALHEDDGAPLVGTKSFGKGTAQTTVSFSDGSSFKYTIAKWLTPKGEWIHGKGLTPDVPVSLPAFTSLPPVDANQLPLRPNSNNSNVAIVQKSLQALGYSVDRTDGYFDVSTEDAVKKFQASNQLPQTGLVDAQTANQLQTALSDLAARSDTQLQKAEQVALEHSS